ncbi:MAG: AraC family transcriptional regulator [Candidatus Merdivicinus sp.]|jgi:AraC-like DNA-binding protein/hemin uptake protein HemP
MISLYVAFDLPATDKLSERVDKSHMLCGLSGSREPVHFLSCGNLVHGKGFLHPRRRLSSEVLLFVRQGEIYLEQNGQEFSLKQGEAAILFAGLEHAGSRPSEGQVSYCWAHFEPPADRKLLEWDEAKIYLHAKEDISEGYVLPEYLSGFSSGKASLFFSQLLDLAQEKGYSSRILDCAMSTLLLEISQKTLLQAGFLETGCSSRAMGRIMEWVELHPEMPMTVRMLAEHFGYNANYLSSAFHREAGISLIRYINQVKIARACRLLQETSLPVGEIARQCGYRDEKYFLRVFREQKGMTPGEYRRTFFRRHLNNS